MTSFEFLYSWLRSLKIGIAKPPSLAGNDSSSLSSSFTLMPPVIAGMNFVVIMLSDWTIYSEISGIVPDCSHQECKLAFESTYKAGVGTMRFNES